MNKTPQPDEKVKSCYKLESGLRLGQEGIHACQLGPFSSPIYFSEQEAANKKITKQDLIDKRKWIFDLLNDEASETPCKSCSMVIEKPFKDVRFDLLGHIDLAATTTCNLRCNFCGYTVHDSFKDASYDALEILKEFSEKDITWNSAVDFNGGEPTLLKDFDAYIKYFRERRTRVFLFTNGLIYKQSVYDGILNGTIRWAIVSLDAGTKTTYQKTKLSPKFGDVLENIARYSEAGSRGGGNCSVKYIFTKDNSGDDDIFGFCYSMLALRPQEVWLTFDFEPLCDLPADSPDLGGYDYTAHVDAYCKTYLMLEKHGLKAVHYAEKHLAPASKHGELLLKMVKEKLNKAKRTHINSLELSDFRNADLEAEETPDGVFNVMKGGISLRSLNGRVSRKLSGKKIAIAPASPKVREFVSLLRSNGADIVGIFDRDKVLEGKRISGVEVMTYERLSAIQPEMTFVATANSVIEPKIIQKVRHEAPNCKIFSFSHAPSVENDRPTEVKTSIGVNSISSNDSENQEESPEEALKELIKWSRHTSG